MARCASPLRAPKEIIISKLDDQLNCVICLDRYSDPRTLSCQHVMCKDCIDRLPVEKDKRRRTIKCPSCRKSTQLDSKGASSLPSAFYINNLLEIDELLRRTPANEPHPICFEHNKPKDMYCETCEELLCLKCIMKYHSDHQCEHAADLYKQHVHEINECLKPVNNRITDILQLLILYDATEQTIRDQSEAVTKEIILVIQQLIDRLQQSREKLLEQVEATTRQKLQLHFLERAEVETTLAQLKSCKEFVEEELRSRSQHQIQTAKKKLVQRIKDTHSSVNMAELQPGQVADTVFVGNESVLSSYQTSELGSVASTINYQSARGVFSVDIPSVVLCQPAEVILTSALSLPVKSVSCKLLASQPGNLSLDCKVEQVNERLFNITFEPPRQPGMHELSVCVDGFHIYGSPFKFIVTELSSRELHDQSLKTFVNSLHHPRGIAVTDDGQYVVITDRDDHCIAVFSKDGTVLTQFRNLSTGTSPGQLLYPTEIAVSADGHIFVKDKTRLHKFTLAGNHVASVDMSEKFLCGLAVHPSGNVLVLHCSSVEVYTPSLDNVINTFGKGIFSAAVDIATDTKGLVYVLTYSHGVHKLTPDGQYLASFGGKGDQPCQLAMPFGLSVDSNDIVYVTDSCRVKQFSSEGEFLGSFGEKNELRVHGISASKNGDLFVCSDDGEVLMSTTCL